MTGSPSGPRVPDPSPAPSPWSWAIVRVWWRAGRPRSWWWRTIAALALPVVLVAGLWGNGHLDLGDDWRSTPLPVAAPQYWSVRHPVRTLAPVVWSRWAACGTLVHSSSDAQIVASILTSGAAPGLDRGHWPPWILQLPSWIGTQVGYQATILMLGAQPLVLWNPVEPTYGYHIYHELVHAGQLARSDADQQVLADSLWAADQRDPMPSARVWNAWASLRVSVLYWLPATDRARAERGLLERVAASTAPTTLQRFGAGLDAAMRDPDTEYAFRPHLAFGQTWTDARHRAAWRQDLRQRLVFEAQAYGIADGCGGRAAVGPAVGPAVGAARAGPVHP